MTLTVFTINDRRRLQHYLNLPIQEVREGSRLYQALLAVERLDADESTTIASDIQKRLTLLDSVDSVDSETSSFGDKLKSDDSQIKRFEEKGFHEVEYFDRGAIGGEANAIAQWMKKLCNDIRRDLGLSQQVTGNEIRSTYPGGGIRPRSNSFPYGTY